MTIMDDFNFYNNENDGYRGGFGDYTDPIPAQGGPVEPEKKPRKKRKALRVVALLLACALVSGCAGVGGAGFALGLVLAVLWDRRVRRQQSISFRITAIAAGD